MAVLDLAATLSDEAHGLGAEGDLLAEGSHLVVATLVYGLIAILLRTDHIVLELAHGVELQPARDLTEGLGSTAQDLVGCDREWLPILVHIGTEEADRGLIREGVEEGRGEDRHHVEVRGASLHEAREEARAIDTLARGEHLVKVVDVLEDEVELLEAAVGSGVAEVQRMDIVRDDVVDEVSLGEFGGLLP